jgi:L-ascorbate metabolism protein UlaG (beta-lactamase superfamily)
VIKISVSERRNPQPQKIAVNDNVTITSWGAIKVNKSHFFPSSFQIIVGELVIYIDPIEIGGDEKADYIFITHSHPDHLSSKDISKLIKSETIIVSPKGAVKKLSKFNCKKFVVKPSDIINFDKFQCEAISAYNINPIFLWIKAHPKSSQNVGYVLTLNNDLRIYHAGDTDFINEIEEIKDISVALVPVGGDNLTMNIEQAAQIANKIKPRILVPMHYELKMKDELVGLDYIMAEGIELKIME